MAGSAILVSHEAMVEANASPGRRVVAKNTIGAVSAIVRIYGRVAVVTIRRCTSIVAVGMAVNAIERMGIG